MPPRLYCAELRSAGVVTLTGGEVHHARDVLRLAQGQAVELFDGCGLIASAEIVEFCRREMVCEIVGSRAESKSAPQITLATAVPKGERFDWLVEKAAELGVARLIPLQTERSTVDPRDSKLARLRQTIIAACKQCRRAHLMELAEIMSWSQLLKSSGSEVIVAHPSGAPLKEFSLGAVPQLTFAIGPEGGFSPAEIAQADAAGCRQFRLGQFPLRIETAALVLAGWSEVQRREIAES